MREWVSERERERETVQIGAQNNKMFQNISQEWIGHNYFSLIIFKQGPQGQHHLELETPH